MRGYKAETASAIRGPIFVHVQDELVGQCRLVAGAQALETGFEYPAADGIRAGKSDQHDGQSPSPFLPRHAVEQPPNDEQVNGR